jgi:hypothetical protein
MSDDDLWRRPQDQPDDLPTGEEPGDEAPAPAPVADETRPISGAGSAPTPPGPSYDSPAGPGGQPAAGWIPYVDPRDPGPGPGYVPPQNPYVPPNEYATPQNPYGSPYQPAYAGGLLPTHPSATSSMVLGIVGLVSILVCAGFLLIVSPVAWVLGAKAVRDIDASPGRYGGRDRAQAGKIMGIIGSVLLVLGVLLIILVVAVAVNSDPGGTTPTYDQNL